eukprot:TRINITY_DN4197_c0_g1_i1.p1 TRINITY_DN4197_c0_g1~~TRINITY_DN4197_c0_g1_i1.p1  ORF type:complete len:722 (+),score=134.76 TRINITY_DN4197_c0_g1_i1:213-2168(+)
MKSEENYREAAKQDKLEEKHDKQENSANQGEESPEEKEAKKDTYYAQYYAKNKETLSLQNKQYHLNNKDAINQKKREYHLNNKEAIKKRKREYYLKNKEAIKEKMKEYHQKNKEVIKEREREYRSNNREAIKERLREYRLNNKEEINKQRREHRLNNPIPRKTRNWQTPENVREFFESVGKQLYIAEPSDWYRISRDQLTNLGGWGLYTAFKSLGTALKFAYPEIEWDESKFSFRGKKSGQRWVRVVLEQILPEKCEIFEDFLHPDLLWDENSKQRMELDIWVPKYNLALEYQGQQHYYDMHHAYGPSGTIALYSERDVKKKNACEKKGITLASIPFWWDGMQGSLNATLYALRPDIFPRTEDQPIPENPPPAAKDEGKGDSDLVAFMMHGREWNVEQDPTDWLVSEKLDGVRAFWDGTHLYSRRGKIIPAPEEFIELLPRGVTLEGELWLGYESFNTLISILKLNDTTRVSELWEDIKFCIFDAPRHPGHYLERLSFARDAISGCDESRINTIVVEKCLGFDHLNKILSDVTDRKGEGLMLYHPQSTYTSGRTSLLLKVKAYSEDDVKFIKCNPNSYTFICEQRDGTPCIVKCSGFDYENAPPTGTVLTVKYSGVHKKSQKMKYPFLLKIRPDLVWDELTEDNPIESATE